MVVRRGSSKQRADVSRRQFIGTLLALTGVVVVGHVVGEEERAVTTPAHKSLTQPGMYNVAGSGDISGVTDAAQINAIAGAGGTAILAPGYYRVNTSLTPTVGGGIVGPGGPNTAVIQMVSGFPANAAMISIADQGCTVRNLKLEASGTPAAGSSGIYINDCTCAVVDTVSIGLLGAWGLLINGDCFNTSVNNLVCAGVSVQNGAGPALANLALSGGGGGGPALQILNEHDVTVIGLGGVSAGVAPTVNIIGACSSVVLDNVDVGPISSFAQPCISIGNSGGASPQGVIISNGFIGGSTPNILVTDASADVILSNLLIGYAETHGIVVNGAATRVNVTDCHFYANGSVPGTNYDLEWTSTGNGTVANNWLDTPLGTGSGRVAAGIHVAAGQVYSTGNWLEGTAPAAPSLLR